MRNLDEDYDRFLGRQQERGVYCWTTHRWYKVKYQEPLSPLDRIAPKTGEEQMGSEAWEGDTARSKPTGPQGKTRALLPLIVEALREGPKSSVELAKAVGIESASALRQVMADYKESLGIVTVRAGQHRYEYTLVGAHDKEAA
jgi:hypothetical protein